MDKNGTLLKKAIEAGRQRQYQEAVKLLERVVSDTDDYPEAYLYLGRSLHALREYNKALLYLMFFHKSRPESSAGNFFLGRTYLAAGSPVKAIEYLEQAAARTSILKPVILLGLAHLRAKNFGAAVEFLGRAVERQPENRRLYTGYLNALLVHGLRRFHAEDFELARQILEFLAGLDLNSVTVHLYLAKTLRELGDFTAAVSQYRVAAALEPDDKLIRLQLADSLFGAGEINEARQILSEIHEILPEGVDFSLGQENVDSLLAVKHFQKGDFAKALFHGCQSLKSRRDADMHLLVGESYRNIGSIHRAGNHFRQVLKANAGSVEARLGLAMIDWQTESFESMISRLEQLKGNAEYEDLGRYYILLGKCRLEYPAEELLDPVRDEIRRSGPDPYILTALGDLYVRLGLEEMATKWYRKALQLNEGHTPAIEGLITCYNTTDAVDELIALYREILVQQPEDVTFRIELVEKLYQAERFAEAAGEAEVLLSAARPDKRTQRLLAICYRRTRRFGDAAVIYRELLREEPDNEVYLRSLLFCLDRSRKRPQAIKLLEKALKYLKQPNSSLYLIQGVLLHKHGDIEAALAAFRSAMELSPGDWRPYYNIGKIYKKKGLDSFADKFSRKAEEMKKR